MRNWWRSQRARLEAYGRLGLGVYAGLYVVNLLVFVAMLRMGLQDTVPWVGEHLGADGATFVGVWALMKLLQLPRLALAVAITPLVARWTGRVPAAPPAADADALPAAEAAAEPAAR